MRKTILFDFISDPMGGLLASARHFLTMIRTYDANSVIVVMELNGSISQHIPQNDSIIWINIDAPGGMNAVKRIALQNIKIPQLIKVHKVDTYVSLSHFLPWTLPSSVHTVIGVSNLAPFSEEAYACEKSLIKKLRLILLKKSILSSCRHADRVVALSETCKQTLLQNGIRGDKISVISNGVKTPSASELNALPNAIKVSNYLLSVSHFYRYKNFETLILAYNQLGTTLQQKFPLYLVGRFYDPVYVDEIKSLIEQLGLKSYIHIVEGLYDLDLFSAMHHCQLFIFPSLIENSPITLLEAMKCGAVTLASDVPAMREFGGDSVQYFTAQDANSLSEKMKYLMSIPHTETLKNDSIKRASQFTWDRFTQKLVATYLT